MGDGATTCEGAEDGVGGGVPDADGATGLGDGPGARASSELGARSAVRQMLDCVTSAGTALPNNKYNTERICALL
jgi:hypothetical protein